MTMVHVFAEQGVAASLGGSCNTSEVYCFRMPSAEKPACSRTYRVR